MLCTLYVSHSCSMLTRGRHCFLWLLFLRQLSAPLKKYSPKLAISYTAAAQKRAKLLGHKLWSAVLIFACIHIYPNFLSFWQIQTDCPHASWHSAGHVGAWWLLLFAFKIAWSLMTQVPCCLAACYIMMLLCCHQSSYVELGGMSNRVLCLQLHIIWKTVFNFKQSWVWSILHITYIFSSWHVYCNSWFASISCSVWQYDASYLVQWFALAIAQSLLCHGSALGFRLYINNDVHVWLQ